MRKRVIGIIVGFIAILFICAVAIFMRNNPKSIKKSADTVRIESLYDISFQEFGGDNFTCTGLTWDKKDDAFWIGDYGALTNIDVPSPRVVEVSADFSKVHKVIELSEVLSADDNLQGVAYDSTSDSLWLAVGDTVKNINKNGGLLTEFSLGKYSKYKSNGICVDDSDNTIWVLCYSKYLLHYDKEGNLIKRFHVNYQNQDHIVMNDGKIFATIGADYNGEENYVVSIDKYIGKIKVEYQAIGSYALEGLCVVGAKLYIANDGLYHDAKIKDSYISEFMLNEQ